MSTLAVTQSRPVEKPAHTSRSSTGGRRALAAALALAVAQSLGATPITVPNGDLSAPGNVGTVGSLIGSGTNLPIGSGPWLGSYFGILGLLAGPSLTISSASQTATINGVIGANLAGLLNNGGWFSQTLSEPWQFGRFYVLSAGVDAGTTLTLGALNTTNVGIALRSGSTVLASSNTAATNLVQLDLLTGTSYRLRFGYLADGSATGNIDLQLFNLPSGLLTVDLLGSVTFADVTLDERDIGAPAAVEIVTTGDLLQAEVNQPFGEPIIALVRDADGDGVPGVTVTFTAPSSGASATLNSPTGGSGLTVTAVTDLDGLATVYAVANGQAGCYRVTAEATAFALAQAVFHLRNWSTDPAQDSIYCNGFQ